MTLVLRAADGREVALGTEEELRQALVDMSAATGGSSGMGRWSFLFGLRPERAMPSDEVTRLAREAADFQQTCGAGLSEQTIELLERLATLDPAQ